jgi:Uma2 family endonuclease
MREIPKRCKLTFDDFRVLMHDDRKGDLLGGVLYLSAPELPAANFLFIWLASLVDTFVMRTELGKLFTQDFSFRFDRYNVTQPDLAFVGKRRRILRHDFAAGAPDTIFEIVAPDSIKRDYKLKRALYERCGVREYWIIDDMIEKVTLLRLNDRGEYRRVPASRGLIRSKVLPGFWLRPGWLWKEPRPVTLDILEQMLGDDRCSLLHELTDRRGPATCPRDEPPAAGASPGGRSWLTPAWASPAWCLAPCCSATGGRAARSCRTRAGSRISHREPGR